VKLLSILIWNIFILSGTVYLIEFRGWNAWWIVLAILMLVVPKE
jgi:hypothetical protein